LTSHNILWLTFEHEHIEERNQFVAILGKGTLHY